MKQPQSKSAIATFFQREYASGILLVFTALLAATIANSPLADIYYGFFDTPLQIRIGELDIAKPFMTL